MFFFKEWKLHNSLFTKEVKISGDFAQQLEAEYNKIAKQEAHIKARAAIRDKQKEEAETLLRAADEELARAEPKLEEAKKFLRELKKEEYHLWGKLTVEDFSEKGNWISYSMKYHDNPDTLFLKNIQNKSKT